jgi:hypothetical protein
MAQAAAAACAGSAGAPGYARHRPEHTVLYRIGAQHYPAFVALLPVRAGRGRTTCGRNSRPTSSAAGSGTVSCGVRCESCDAENLVAFS